MGRVHSYECIDGRFYLGVVRLVRERAMAAKGPIIALDAMGGDNAPGIVVGGAAIARERFPESRFLLFGDRAVLEPLVAKTSSSWMPLKFAKLLIRFQPIPSLRKHCAMAVTAVCGRR